MNPVSRSLPPPLVIPPPPASAYDIIDESVLAKNRPCSLLAACLQGNLRAVEAQLATFGDQNLYSLFVYDSKDGINLIHVAALMRNGPLAEKLLSFLYKRDPSIAKEMLLAKYGGFRSPLYISLVGEVQKDIVVTLLEWAAKLGVSPEEMADGLSPQNLQKTPFASVLSPTEIDPFKVPLGYLEAFKNFIINQSKIGSVI